MPEKNVIRKQYLDKLKKMKDLDVIKVITGVRRCGKSTLLYQFRDWLFTQGVSEEQIIEINLEDLVFEELEDYHKLHQYVLSRLPEGKKTYLFIDEIQNTDKFEKAINSLYLNKDIDIYITGSNSRILSGELSTRLSGRYIELPVLPLSLSEFSALMQMPENEAWPRYRTEGGFPYLAFIPEKPERLDYLEGIYNTVLVKDIVERKKITNLNLFSRVTAYLMDNIGNPVNVSGIANYLTSAREKTTRQTIQKYLDGLKESFIFYEVKRLDIKGKELLKQNSKYYLSDIGFRQLLTRNTRRDAGHILENLVFLELLRRGFKVYTGIINGTEVDFAAEDNQTRYYIQVSQTVAEEETYQREVRPFASIPDHYPKILITLDEWTQDVDGIRHLNALDFLNGARLG